jgi:hypothetical protein
MIKIEIKEKSEFAYGMKFGDVGAYEKLKGRIHFSIDPKSPAQNGITDIELAPMNAQGLIEFSSDSYSAVVIRFC